MIFAANRSIKHFEHPGFQIQLVVYWGQTVFESCLHVHSHLTTAFILDPTVTLQPLCGRFARC